MTARVCSFEGCGRPHHARGWCGSHYKQWQAGKPLAPVITSQERRITPDVAEFDVAEFELLLSSGCSFDRALQRMGMGAAPVLRRYRMLDREVPPGLWAFAKRPARRAAA